MDGKSRLKQDVFENTIKVFEELKIEDVTSTGGANFCSGELIGSGEDSSGCSSRMSTKSEKNMADFDGENVLSDEEIVQLTSTPARHGAGSGSGISGEFLRRKLASMAGNYRPPQRGRQLGS